MKQEDKNLIVGLLSGNDSISSSAVREGADVNLMIRQEFKVEVNGETVDALTKDISCPALTIACQKKMHATVLAMVELGVNTSNQSFKDYKEKHPMFELALNMNKITRSQIKIERESHIRD